jgi:hypothetical protein
MTNKMLYFVPAHYTSCAWFVSLLCLHHSLCRFRAWRLSRTIWCLGVTFIQFHLWVSHSCDFVFPLHLRVISCLIIAFVQFHVWASPLCNFMFDPRLCAIFWVTNYLVLFVIFSHQGEKCHPRLWPSRWRGYWLWHPDGLLWFLDARVSCFLSTSFLSMAFISPLAFQGWLFFHQMSFSWPLVF